MSEEYVLREFTCKECGHRVVVNPNCPPDYEPNICTPCFNESVVRSAKLIAEVSKFLEKLCK